MRKKFILFAVLLTSILLHAQSGEPLTVRFVRHGQPGVRGTKFSQADKKAWISPLGLTPLGREQARLTGEFLKKEGINWQLVIASPLERTAETANIICGILGKKYYLEADVRELGNPVRYETLPALRKRFENIAPDETFAPSPALKKGIKENARRGLRGKQVLMALHKKGIKGPVLIVTHGSFTYWTLREITQKSAPLLWNCGMIELQIWPDGRGKVVKPNFPEALPYTHITDNRAVISRNPYGKTFKSHPQKPKTLDFINDYFTEFLAGKLYIRTDRSIKMTCKNKTATVKTKSVPAALDSPVFPVLPKKEYCVKIKVSGTGSGKLTFADTEHKTFALTPQAQEHVFKFSFPKRLRGNLKTFCLTVDSNSTMNIHAVRFSPVK